MKNFLSILFLSICLITCKEDDPCDGVVCQNGGTCINGSCQCSERYEGADCSKQATPDKIRINAISITKFPATDTGGASWDQLPSSGADLFIVIFKGNQNIFQSNYIENANPSAKNRFVPASTLEVEANTVYDIYLLDDDGGLDPDVIRSYEFDFDNSDLTGFPSTITMSNSETSIEFEVNYIF